MLVFQRNGLNVKVRKISNVYSIDYPCSKSYECSSIETVSERRSKIVLKSCKPFNI